MFWLIIYLAVWLFVASLFEDRLVQVIWTLLCFGPLIKAFVDAFRKSCGKPAAKTKTPSSSAMTNRVDSGRSSSAAAPKLFSKAVPESAVRFPVSNRANRRIPDSVHKGVPEGTLVMPLRRIEPWRAIPAGQRNCACREYFAYHLRQPWILGASPLQLGLFLFGAAAWVAYHRDRRGEESPFAKAGEDGNIFCPLFNEYSLFPAMCERLDLVTRVLGSPELAAAYVLEKEEGLNSLLGRNVESVVIDAGVWANPELKSVQLSDWSAGAAAAGLASAVGFALFMGDVEGAEIERDLTILSGEEGNPEPYMQSLADQADDLHEEYQAEYGEDDEYDEYEDAEYDYDDRSENGGGYSDSDENAGGYDFGADDAGGGSFGGWDGGGGWGGSG